MDGQALTLGGLSINQREAWVESIFTRVKDFVADFADLEITTCVSPCITTLKNSYVRGQTFPFVNIPIRYRNQELLGLYEYFGEQLPLMDQYIYCDIVVQSIYYNENLAPADLQALEEKARQLFQTKHLEVRQFEGGMATLTIEREILDGSEFLERLRDLLTKAVEIQMELK